MKKLAPWVYVAVLILVGGWVLIPKGGITTPTEVRSSLPNSEPVAACAAAYILPLLAIGFVTVKEVPPLAARIHPCAIWAAILGVVVGIGLAIAGKGGGVKDK